MGSEAEGASRNRFFVAAEVLHGCRVGNDHDLLSAFRRFLSGLFGVQRYLAATSSPDRSELRFVRDADDGIAALLLLALSRLAGEQEALEARDVGAGTWPCTSRAGVCCVPFPFVFVLLGTHQAYRMRDSKFAAIPDLLAIQIVESVVLVKKEHLRAACVGLHWFSHTPHPHHVHVEVEIREKGPSVHTVVVSSSGGMALGEFHFAFCVALCVCGFVSTRLSSRPQPFRVLLPAALPPRRPLPLVRQGCGSVRRRQRCKKIT